jgi:hypothetical protein
VRVDFGQARAIGAVDIPESGRVIHLPGYGPIRVFRVVDANGDTDNPVRHDICAPTFS